MELQSPIELQAVMEWIKLWWGYLCLMAGIAAAIWKKVISPIINRRKAKREKSERQQQVVLDMLADIKLEIKRLGDNVGTLQHDRLQQAYIQYMKRGWCESDTKESLISMFNEYTSSGRNHLYSTYKDDIMELPEVEPGSAWGARTS